MNSQQVINAPIFGKFDNGLPRKNLTAFFIVVLALTLGWGAILGAMTYQMIDAYENHGYVVSATITDIPSDRDGSNYAASYTDSTGNPNGAILKYPAKAYRVGDVVTLRCVILAPVSGENNHEDDVLYENDLMTVLWHTSIPYYLAFLAVVILCLVASIVFGRRATRKQAQLMQKP